MNIRSNIKYYGICTALLLCAATGVRGQAPGSESVYGGSTSVKSIGTGGISADVSESVYIGPGTHVIDGTWEIYAQRIIIDPVAVITGSGTIQIHNPGDLISIYPAALSMPTRIDGNAPLAGAANNIDVNISHFNDAGILLTEMGFPSDLIIDGWMNVTNSSSLYVGKNLSLEVDGADITLGTSGVVGDLRFDADATISNYRPGRMVITNNSILSHVVKENFSSAFTFPVGIADGNYTPAQISNGTANTVRVSVQDYTASLSPEATADPGPGGISADGMNRTWHIYADNAGVGSTLSLQHNSSSNQSGFNDAAHYVTQWGATVPNTSGDNNVGFGTSSWQTNTLGPGATGSLIDPAGSLGGSTMRSRSYGSLATSGLAEESYFTKSADPFHPLPVQLLSFGAEARDCDADIRWTTADESGLQSFRLLHSTDGNNYVTLATLSPQGRNSAYHYIHRDAGDGRHLYKLIMTEADLSMQYSGTVSLRISCGNKDIRSVRVYPNPASEILIVEGMGTERRHEIRLLSMDGKVVISVQTQADKTEMNLAGLPAAGYMLQVIEGQEVRCNTRINKL